ncbi:hypothetical protein M8C21_021976, partial [Ambrosia artemisiifolia]
FIRSWIACIAFYLGSAITFYTPTPSGVVKFNVLKEIALEYIIFHEFICKNGQSEWVGYWLKWILQKLRQIWIEVVLKLVVEVLGEALVKLDKWEIWKRGTDMVENIKCDHQMVANV